MGNTDSIWGVVGIIVFLCGIYAIYSAIKMKTSGDINASLLLGKDYMYKTCKNKEAYIQKAWAGSYYIRICGCCLRSN